MNRTFTVNPRTSCKSCFGFSLLIFITLHTTALCYALRHEKAAASDAPSSPQQEAAPFFLWQTDWKSPLTSDTEPVAVSEEPSEEKEDSGELEEPLDAYLESLRRWKYPPTLIDLDTLDTWKPRKRRDEKGIALPMDSNLQITGFQSVTIEVNKTHYFGDGDLNRYGGYGYGGGYGSYGSGLDLGLTSSYTYDDFGYGSSGFGDSYGGGYGSSYGGYGTTYGGGGYGGYSGYRSGIPRASGFNMRQSQQFGLHGRVGERTHIAVDYSAGSDSPFGGGGYGGGYGGYGGYGLGGAKEQKIKIWYEGKPESIIKTVAFGDITLTLPNTRFLNINRNLFGLEGVFEWKNTRVTLFGSRSKGVREVRTFRGQSRRASGYGSYGPRGIQIADASYVKNRFYLIHQGPDGLLHDAYLPIKTGSEEIYIDDGVVGNNQGGKRTPHGYFNPQFPGQDYNIDYETGEIEFLSPIAASYTIVVAYEYLGDGGGTIGTPGNVFPDEPIAPESTSRIIGFTGFTGKEQSLHPDNLANLENPAAHPDTYVVLKEKGFRGTEASHVYSLGNRNINPRDFQLSIIRQGQSETFQTDAGRVPYIEIFGLDRNGDGNVDAQFVDYDRGILRFPDFRPFEIRDPGHPYHKYRDALNNPAIYLESLRTTDAVYTLIADYAYQSETYNVGLFVIPNSETVRLNGRQLVRDADYMMVYEVGTIRFFTELDEFDEIVVEFEKTPFGGASQQAVAGVWMEYTHKPKAKSQREQNLQDRFNQLGGFQGTQPGIGSEGLGGTNLFSGTGTLGNRSSYGSGFGGFGGTGGFGGGYGGGLGGYGSGYSYGGFGGRSRSSYLGSYGAGMNYFTPVFQKGFNLSTGYILNTGQQPAEIPDVNNVPNRLQAFNINTSFGRTFNIASLFNPLPFINVRHVPLSIDFSGEAAYSHNNPNSVGVALIDSMEGAKETTTIPTLKYNWKPCSLPLPRTAHTTVETDNVGFGTTSRDAQPPTDLSERFAPGQKNENRALFNVVLKDKDESEAVGNYMRNRDVPASSIQPLSLSTEERLIMEIGYDFTDLVEEWGGFASGISNAGVDFSERGFVELWARVQGDDNVTLFLDIGIISEDSDSDERLDSEDLPDTLLDINADGKVDALDLDLENLPHELRYRGNGALDTGEDTGWTFNGEFENIEFGRNNQVLDSEDLNGDGELNAIDAYFQLAIPFNQIPNEWIKSKNSNGWMFLSIPLTQFVPQGTRVPSLVFVQHFRLWLMKNRPGTVQGTFQWASIEIVGNKWQQGIVTKAQEAQSPLEENVPSAQPEQDLQDFGELAAQEIVQDTLERFIVGTKDNFSYDDYQRAYLEIEDNELFKKLHPFTATSLGFQTQQQREQTLSLAYYLFPGSYGITSKQLKGLTQSEGQDFSKHDTLRLWLYGDKSDTTFVLQLAPSVRTGYRSAFYNADPFVNPQQEEEDINVFENLTDYYEYTVPIDFEGWRLIEIDLRDAHRNTYPDIDASVKENEQSTTSIAGYAETGSSTNPLIRTPSEQQNTPDGHPDGFTIRGRTSTQLSIKNIGGILLGIRNDTGREISGEVWVNEIHLGEPLVRSGWARRGNMSVSLGSLIKLRGGYASQDKDFESGAGEIGRQRLSSRGYSTTNNDFNIDADVNIFSWLPIRYSVRQQDSETEARRGSYTSFQSGKSETLNRDVSVQLNRNPYPNLGFAYNYQDFWNERQGTQISHLYTGVFQYNLGQKLGMKVQYRHEDILAKPETATDTSDTTASYYSYGYGRNRDEKTDSGSITLNITPTNAFSLNPSYDVRRTLEKRETTSYRSPLAETPTPAEESDATEPDFSIAEREHRLSLTPRLNRDMLGLRPTVTSRLSFRENWFSQQKNASLNGNISLGINLRIQKWFGWLLPEENGQKENEQSTTSIAGYAETGSSTNQPLRTPREQQKMREEGIDEAQIQELEENRGDWIERDKPNRREPPVSNSSTTGDISNRQRRLRMTKKDVIEPSTHAERLANYEETLFHRILKTFTVSTNANFTATESYRQLASGISAIEMWQLPDDAQERTHSRRSNRYTVRSAVEPWTWASLGANYSTSDSFRKSAGSTYTSHAETYEADLKLKAQEKTSFQLRYSFTMRNTANLAVTLSDSAAHTPSLSWHHNWGAETRTALGIRTTLRDQERSGIVSSAFIVTPNLSVDYRYRTENGIRIPFFGRIPLKHDLELTNTLSWAIRREEFGANREERSERYETTLRAGYKISTHFTANLHLGVSYNNDRVEEGRDFLSIASALTVRGELQ